MAQREVSGVVGGGGALAPGGLEGFTVSFRLEAFELDPGSSCSSLQGGEGVYPVLLSEKEGGDCRLRGLCLSWEGMASGDH